MALGVSPATTTAGLFGLGWTPLNPFLDTPFFVSKKSRIMTLEHLPSMTVYVVSRVGLLTVRGIAVQGRHAQGDPRRAGGRQRVVAPRGGHGRPPQRAGLLRARAEVLSERRPGQIGGQVRELSFGGRPWGVVGGTSIVHIRGTAIWAFRGSPGAPESFETTPRALRVLSLPITCACGSEIGAGSDVGGCGLTPTHTWMIARVRAFLSQCLRGGSNAPAPRLGRGPMPRSRYPLRAFQRAGRPMQRPRAVIARGGARPWPSRAPTRCRTSASRESTRGCIARAQLSGS